MEPEKFLTHTEFNALLNAAKDDRERCILLLLAGVGLRVGEMTQIRAEDIDFSKGYLHDQAINAKFKKPRTVVLLPQVADDRPPRLDRPCLPPPGPPHEYASKVACAPGILASAFARPLACSL